MAHKKRNQPSSTHPEKSSNDRKIARIARIWTIYAPHWSHRHELFLFIWTNKQTNNQMKQTKNVRNKNEKRRKKTDGWGGTKNEVRTAAKKRQSAFIGVNRPRNVMMACRTQINSNKWLFLICCSPETEHGTTFSNFSRKFFEIFALTEILSTAQIFFKI